MAWFFGPVRQSLVSIGATQAAVDNLEIALRDIQREARAANSGSQDGLSELRTELQAYMRYWYQRGVADAAAMDLVPPTDAEIRALVDYYLLTEGGDTLFDENGDGLLMESAP